MISSLHIENVAVLKCLDVEIGAGLTVLSGETGAGKSIIIDSLGLLLGAKADKELIRTGESTAVVSALFTEISPQTCHELSELGFECEDKSVMLSRTLTQSSSGARINGRAVTLGVLREVGRMLINIHGQNDNQQLLDQKNHVRLLDSFASNGALLEEYGALYRQILHTRAEIDSLERDEREGARQRELLEYQIKDIDATKLKAGEEEALVELVRRLESAEKISKATALTLRAIRGGDRGNGAVYLCQRSESALESISDALPEAQTLAQRLRDIAYELEDIAECATSLSDIGEGDPSAKLDKAQSRLNAIAKLKRKYGSTVEEILAYRDEVASKLDLIDNAGERREELSDELCALEEKANALCSALTQRRLEHGEKLAHKVCDTLAFLDMPKVVFEISVTPEGDFGAFGKDRVEFLISTNPGEPLMPMARIASGGELARIMLSLKNVLNEFDGVQTVIFDEIDTGISGKTSRKVGIKLKEIGRASQVLCVTHSAQIASLANSHLYIYKTEDGGRVSTSIKLLDGDARIEEISRILGGIEITDAVRSAARELLEEGESY